MAFRIFVLWSQLALTFADYELNRNFEQGLGHGQFILHNNSYLAVLKLSSENTSDPRECVFACVVSPLCLSYNVASTADNNGKFLCEILGTDKYRNPSQFIRKTNSKHYSISVSDHSKTEKRIWQTFLVIAYGFRSRPHVAFFNRI